MTIETIGADRRKLLGGLTLSAVGLAAVLGTMGKAEAKSKKANIAQDVSLINAAIALEHEGIAAYTIAAGSGLLAPAVVQVGVLFRGHHQRHRDELVKAVTDLGGKPAIAKTDAEYAADLNAGSLKNQEDVLRLAVKLETGAANAYIGVIPSVGAKYHEVLARMAGDEAYHVAFLSSALGLPVPEGALIFGG